MNLSSSIKSLISILKEDAEMSRFGVPRGWLLHLHYQGRLADRLKKSPVLRSCTLQVNDRLIDLSLSAAYEGAFKGVFLDDEYQCKDELKTPPRRILDLGANIGMGTLHLHTQFPDAEFICVEPDERNMALLKTNLEINGVSSRIFQAAVGANAGLLKLRYGKDPTCSALETSPIHDLEHCTSVEVRTVEMLLQEAGWDTVDLVKIDIEGIEDEILSTNNSWLSCVSNLIMEIHPNTTPERIASSLKPFGFNLRQVRVTREPVYLAVRSED